MQDQLNDFIILSGRSNLPLAQDVGKLLKKEVYQCITSFADGEIRVKIPVNIRRRNVFIIQSTSSPVNDNLMEVILMIDAAKRASASRISLVIPYFGYSRQDRKEASRVPISSAVVASMLEHAGCDSLLTIDIHSEQEEGFVSVPWDNLYSSYSLIPTIREKKLSNLVIASPDKGGMIRATGYARLLKAEGVAVVYKKRDFEVNNKSEVMAMIGKVRDKDVLIVDDLIDTAGTIAHAADHIKRHGARSIRVAATHGLFSGPALARLSQSAIEEIIITDSIKQKDEVINNKKITIVSVANLLAEAMKKIESGDSISRNLILER